jgi:hypothetical protein
MAFMLCLWTSLLLGIMYMSFTAWSIVYKNGYGFETQIVGLTYIPLGLGITIGALLHPVWHKYVPAFFLPLRFLATAALRSRPASSSHSPPSPVFSSC